LCALTHTFLPSPSPCVFLADTTHEDCALSLSHTHTHTQTHQTHMHTHTHSVHVRVDLQRLCRVSHKLSFSHSHIHILTPHSNTPTHTQRKQAVRSSEMVSCLSVTLARSLSTARAETANSLTAAELTLTEILDEVIDMYVHTHTQMYIYTYTQKLKPSGLTSMYIHSKMHRYVPLNIFSTTPRFLFVFFFRCVCVVSRTHVLSTAK